MATFAADAALLHTAKGHAQVTYEPAIHPDGAGVHGLSHAVRAPQVVGPDYSSQAVLAVVGQPYGFFLALEALDDHHRSEDLLLGTAHLVVYVGDDCRLQEVTLLPAHRRFAAVDHLAAFVLGDVQVALDPCQVLGRDNRPEIGGLIQRVADLQLRSAVDEVGQEAVVDGVLHQ